MGDNLEGNWAVKQACFADLEADRFVASSAREQVLFAQLAAAKARIRQLEADVRVVQLQPGQAGRKCVIRGLQSGFF